VKHEVHLPQGTIRYREQGHGEPLLFIHGIVMNGDLWRKVVPLLEDRFRCIAPDWPLGAHSVPMKPGTDLSLPGLARLVVDFMDAIGLESATLVGNDGGGAIAQMVAVDHPERVDRLVLNSSELYHLFLPPIFKPLQMASRIPGFLWATAQLMRLRPLLRLPFAYGRSIKSGPPERDAVRSYLGPGRSSAGVRRDLRAYFRAVDNRYTLDAAERLKAFDKPVLLAWAEEDRLFPLEYPRRMAAELPNARLELIPDSYTFVPEDQPEALAAAIAAFVREDVTAAR
jgi:pimeloyl-ACP methyl ester carboxylesterase